MQSQAIANRKDHARYGDARTGQRGGALKSLGLNMLGTGVEAEFDRTSSKTVTQRIRSGINRLKETEEVKKARKLSKEGLSGLAELLERVHIEQYTNAADIKTCREAWEDSIEASYRDITRIKIDQTVFKRLLSSKMDNTTAMDISLPNSNEKSSNEYSLVSILSDEIIELVDERRAKKGFWVALFQVPVGHDEDGRRRRILQILGVRELHSAIPRHSPITYGDTSGCYYRSREAWDGSDQKLFSENDWPLHLKTAAMNIEQQRNTNNDSNIITRENVNKLLDLLPTATRNLVVDVVTSVASEKWNMTNDSNWTQNLSDHFRNELKRSLDVKGIKEWEAPSRTIASMCMLIFSVERGNIGFSEANGLLHELNRRVFVCFIRETARDLVRKMESMLRLVELEKQAEALSTMVGSQLMSIPSNLYETAHEYRALGFNLSSFLEGTVDKLSFIEDGAKVLYRNMEYGVYFSFDNVTISGARDLCATCLLLMRGVNVESFAMECQNEAQRLLDCEPPPAGATYVYNETRAAMSVKLKKGEVNKVVNASDVDHMRSGFLFALDADDKKGYRAMVLEGGGIFVIEYEGTIRHSWVNIGSGIPWLITGGGQRSKALGAILNPVMLVWRDFVLPILSSHVQVRISNLMKQFGSGKTVELFPNLVFEITASLLGRGRLLVVAPELEGSIFTAIGLDRKRQSYKDYVQAKNEKDSKLEDLYTLFVDDPIRLCVNGISVNNILRCGGSLEYVIEGYWEGDNLSHCILKKSTQAGSINQNRCLGQPEMVDALFE